MTSRNRFKSVNRAGEASAVSTSIVARWSGSAIGGRSSRASIEPEPRSAATTDHILGRRPPPSGAATTGRQPAGDTPEPTCDSAVALVQSGVEIEAHAGNGGGVNGGLGAS